MQSQLEAMLEANIFNPRDPLPRDVIGVVQGPVATNFYLTANFL